MHVKQEWQDKGTIKRNYYVRMITIKSWNVNENITINTSKYHVNDTISKIEIREQQILSTI